MASMNTVTHDITLILYSFTRITDSRWLRAAFLNFILIYNWLWWVNEYCITLRGWSLQVYQTDDMLLINAMVIILATNGAGMLHYKLYNLIKLYIMSTSVSRRLNILFITLKIRMFFITMLLIELYVGFGI